MSLGQLGIHVSEVASMLIVLSAILASQAPLSKWRVDFADAHCDATRTYGTEDKPLSLSIRPPLDAAATTRLTFEGEIRQLSGQLEKSATLDFGDGGLPYRTHVQPALGENGFCYVLDLPESQARRLRRAETVELKTSARVGGQYQVAPAVPLFNALDRCVADLRKRVGVETGTGGSTQPATATVSLARVFSSSKFWTAEFHSSKTNRNHRQPADRQGWNGTRLLRGHGHGLSRAGHAILPGFPEAGEVLAGS